MLELRRLKVSLDFDSVLEQARKAEDEVKWYDYINAMRGVLLTVKIDR